MRLVSVVLIASLSVVSAQPAKSPVHKNGFIAKMPEIQTDQLANGLRIAFLKLDAAPVVAVQVWYHAGSKDEPRDRRGSAHMFEHMMFKGTEHVRSEAHAQMINNVGGYVNAQTDEDATHFIDTMPASYLDFAVQLEAERMRHLLFRKTMVDGERQVVEEEIRRNDNVPALKGFLRFLEIAYKAHPYAWTAGGTIKDLDATTPADLKKFYDTYYVPNNAMLVVVGNTTLDKVKAAADKYFGPIAKGAEIARKLPVEPAQTAKRKETVEAGQVGITFVGWHIPMAKDHDVYALQVAAIVLGSGESARLKLRLKSTDPKTKHPLALEAGMEAVVREDPGMVIGLGAYLDPAQADPVEAAIFDEVTKLGAGGPPTNVELRKAKNQVQSGFVFSLEHAQGLAEAIGRSWILTGEPTKFLGDVDEIEAVTAADVQRVVKKYLTPDKATVVVIPPPVRGK